MPAKRKRHNAHGARLLLTASAPSLLERGSDRRFRELVNDLLTLASRMGHIRDALADHIGVSGPQYSLMMILAKAGQATAMPVSSLAQHLHVSNAFVTVEVNKLVRAGLVLKTSHPLDGRSVLLRLSTPGMALIAGLAPVVCAANDRLFGWLSSHEFQRLSQLAGQLVAHSKPAYALVARPPTQLRQRGR